MRPPAQTWLVLSGFYWLQSSLARDRCSWLHSAGASTSTSTSPTALTSSWDTSRWWRGGAATTSRSSTSSRATCWALAWSAGASRPWWRGWIPRWSPTISTLFLSNARPTSASRSLLAWIAPSKMQIPFLNDRPLMQLKCDSRQLVSLLMELKANGLSHAFRVPA